MKRFFEEAENYSNDKNVYKEVPSIEAYIEPSQASTMELFLSKKPVNYFGIKALSYMSDWVLKMPLGFC